MIIKPKRASMRSVPFVKMHGIGNDFVLVDNRKLNLTLSTDEIINLSHRHTGIGCDQLLLLSPSEVQGCDAAYEFYNPDGSQAEQCGNGQRCLSLYLHQQNPTKMTFKLSGKAGIVYSEILANNNIKVNMGQMKSLISKKVYLYSCYELDFGNPHLVTCVNNVTAYELEKLNQNLKQYYPEGINLEIVEVISSSKIKIRVHERGTGETLACGSGACAAAYALMQTGKLKHKVKVILPGGELMVEYNQQQNTIYLTGSAQSVFIGEISL